MNRYEVTLTQKVYREVEITKTFEVDAQDEDSAEKLALDSFDFISRSTKGVTLTDEQEDESSESNDVETEDIYLLEEDIEEDEE